MKLVLYIFGSLAAIYVLYVFAFGIVITFGAEYEWTRGRRIRGAKAVLLGVAMMLSFPLFTTFAWIQARLDLLGGFGERASVAALITAVGYWMLLRGTTRNLDADDQ